MEEEETEDSEPESVEFDTESQVDWESDEDDDSVHEEPATPPAGASAKEPLGPLPVLTESDSAESEADADEVPTPEEDQGQSEPEEGGTGGPQHSTPHGRARAPSLAQPDVSNIQEVEGSDLPSPGSPPVAGGLADSLSSLLRWWANVTVGPGRCEVTYVPPPGPVGSVSLPAPDVMDEDSLEQEAASPVRGGEAVRAQPPRSCPPIDRLG